jgi:DNA polymerase-1
MKHLLLDGFNIAFRVYHGMPALTRSDGFPIGAIQGWVWLLWKLQEQEAPCQVTVFFDKEGSQRHLAIHAEYKAGRTPMPEELAKQIPELKTVTALLGFRVVEQAGIEADDLIASAAKVLSEQGNDVRIASADKDFAQLVNERVHLLNPPPPKQSKERWVELDAAGVVGKFGVPPERIVDYLSLIGDTVDNIPGLSGVGPKTALAWLLAHGSIDGILAAREQIEPVRLRELLRTADALLALNRELITFRTDFPGDWTSVGVVDEAGARAFFERMSMRAVGREFERRISGGSGSVSESGVRSAPESADATLAPAPKRPAKTEQLELF